MGKSESTQCYSHCIEARQAHDLSSGPKENRGSAASTVGEGEGGEEEGLIQPQPGWECPSRDTTNDESQQRIGAREVGVEFTPDFGQHLRVEVGMSSRMATVQFALVACGLWATGCCLSVPLSAQAQSAWVQLQDSSPEHAFVLDVPKGWTARAGAFRLGYSDVRLMVDLKSPDGKTNVRLGEVSIPAYALPTPYHPREGEFVDLGAQAQLTVASYHTGQQYAEKYAQSRFKQSCKSLTPEAHAASVSIPDYLPPDPAAKSSSAGEVSYRCDSGSGAMTAFVYAKTNLGEKLWTVRTLVSYLAPPEQASLAADVAQLCVRSFRLNPQWVERQNQMDAEALDDQRQRQAGRVRQIQMQVAQFEQSMQAMQQQVASFERGQQRSAAQSEEWGNILTGITPTVDSLGNRLDVWTGTKSRYWENGRGTIINSDVVPPGGGWTERKTPQ
jgi:hypothetical protein